MRLFTETLVLDHYPAAQRFDIDIKSPDPHFSFSRCKTPDISQHGSHQLRARILVKVDCGGGLALHIPVNIAVFSPVLVASTPLARKTALTASDLIKKEVDVLSNTRVFISDEGDAIGKELKRAVRAGTIITPGMLALPTLIKRGDSVIIIAQKGPLVVRMSGTALASGIMGQQITVRNNASERVVKGWIRDSGTVYVPM